MTVREGDSVWTRRPRVSLYLSGSAPQEVRLGGTVGQSSWGVGLCPTYAPEVGGEWVWPWGLVRCTGSVWSLGVHVDCGV